MGLKGPGRTALAWRGTCRRRAARSPRFVGPTASSVGTAASPTPSTPRQLPERCWRARRRSLPRPATIGGSSCEFCASPVVLQFSGGLRRSTKCPPWGGEHHSSSRTSPPPSLPPNPPTDPPAHPPPTLL